MRDIKEGDYVKVIDTGETHPHYEGWLDTYCPPLRNIWDENNSPKEYGLYTVLKIEEHLDGRKVLCFIYDANDQKGYIINIEGLTLTTLKPNLDTWEENPLLSLPTESTDEYLEFEEKYTASWLLTKHPETYTKEETTMNTFNYEAEAVATKTEVFGIEASLIDPEGYMAILRELKERRDNLKELEKEFKDAKHIISQKKTLSSQIEQVIKVFNEVHGDKDE